MAKGELNHETENNQLLRMQRQYRPHGIFNQPYPAFNTEYYNRGPVDTYLDIVRHYQYV